MGKPTAGEAPAGLPAAMAGAAAKCGETAVTAGMAWAGVTVAEAIGATDVAGKPCDDLAATGLAAGSGGKAAFACGDG